MDTFIRSELLLGEGSINTLKSKTILVFGCGGVGSYVIEGLVRTGISNFIIVDNDTVSKSNINRQIIATANTVGKSKVEVTKERILSINQAANVKTFETFILEDSLETICFENVDYVVDCIDTISGKIAIIKKAKELNIPIISSMGTGNKLDPLQFKITDISKTSVCPLAKVMRYELKKRNIKNVKVLFSTEIPIDLSNNELEKKLLQDEASVKHQIPGSVSFVPSIAGLLIAREIILDLLKG
jgi:tRNA A37 threonylcarbamoyladenosine dehydratase